MLQDLLWHYKFQILGYDLIKQQELFQNDAKVSFIIQFTRPNVINLLWNNLPLILE